MKKLCILSIAVILFSAVRAQNEVVINVLDKSNSGFDLLIHKSSKIRIEDFYKSQKVGNIKRTTDSTYVMKIDNISEPQLFSGLWRRDQTLILIPGDTINVILTPPSEKYGLYDARFYGKNEENYNKYAELKETFNKNELSRLFKKSLKEYIQKLDSAYVVNTRIIEEQVTSPLLKNIMLNEEIAEFFELLNYPNSKADEKLTHMDILKLKDKFFKGKITNNSSLLMEDGGFTSGIKCLSNLLTDNIESEHPLMAATDTINKYFGGELKNYLLVNKYNDYCMRYARKKMNHPDLDEWFDLYSGKMEKEYNDFILFAREQYKKYTEPFPEEVLKVQLTNLSDSTIITFQELLDKHKGKQIVLDNWASWCGPCAREIKEGKQNTQELENRGNVFVYLSLDKTKDFKKAKIKATELDIVKKAYLVSGDFSSIYAKYINVAHIPHFVLIGKDGILKRNNLSFPSSGDFRSYE